MQLNRDSQGSTRFRPNAEDVAKKVDKDIAGHVSIASIKEFLNTLLKVDTEAEQAIGDLAKRRPRKFIPEAVHLEKELYEPFVAKANTVLDAYDGAVHSYWTSRPNETPKDGDKTLPLLRPDAACVLGDIRPLARLKIACGATDLDLDDNSQLDKVFALLDAAVDFASSHVENQRLNDQRDDIEALKDKIQKGDRTVEVAKGWLFETAVILSALAKEEGHKPMTTFSEMAKEMWTSAKVIWLLSPLDKINKSVLAKIGKTKSDPAYDKIEDMNEVWWLRVVVPVEMKAKKLVEDRVQGSAQLCRYMRMVMKTQINRNFVIGLLLCHDELRLFFCDRAGLIATTSWISVNTVSGFKSFARIVLALSSMDPTKLGWNNNMRLCSQLALNATPSSLQFFSSTSPKVKMEDYGESVRSNIWARSAPESQNSTTLKHYLTIKTVSWMKSEEMVGRSAVVWVVKELNSNHDNVKDPYMILKQSWSKDSEDSLTEKDFHGPIRLDNVGFVLSSVKRIEMRTDEFRGNILTRAWPWANGIAERLIEDASGPPIPEEDLDPFLLAVDDTIVHDQIEPGSVPRVLTETLVTDYGWSVKHFLDLVELVKVIRDAINGHRNLYFKNLVLHRDVSDGNILIRPDDSDPVTTSGCLIDLDHATRSKERIEFSLADMQIPQSRKTNIQEDDGRTPEEVELICRRCKGDWKQAGILSEQMKKLNMELNYPTPEQYERWINEPETRPPLWTNAQNAAGERTGTLAFMSYEVIRNAAYLTPDYDDGYLHCRRSDLHKSHPIHNAIHDIESFFWVLVYQCLVRMGPGGPRRPELFTSQPQKKPKSTQEKPLSPAQLIKLREYKRALFDDGGASKKHELFTDPPLFETQIIEYFHPYFSRLKPLVREWWHLLQCTYRTYNDVAQALIHEEVIALLTKHLDLIAAGEGDMKPTEAETNEEASVLREKELGRRKRDLERLKNAPWNQVEVEGGKGKGKAGSGTK